MNGMNQVQGAKGTAGDPAAGAGRDRPARRPAVKEWPVGERPRERLLRHGARALTDAELLALLVGSGPRGQSALDVGRSLAQIGWQGLAQMGPEELCRRPGIGPARAAQVLAALEAGRRFRVGPSWLTTVHSGDDVARLLEDMALLGQEEFRVLLLNSRHRVLRVDTLFVGGQTSVEVHPREVYRRAVESGAAGIVAAHNHPSGDPTPSVEDRRLTKRLQQAGQVLGIPLLDHVIIGQGQYVSFRESGFMTASV